MAKLRKQLPEAEKEKNIVVTGKITKFKKIVDLPQTKKVQVKLHSPLRAQNNNSENCICATPLSANSTLKFTSTPSNVEGTITNGSGRLSLNKLPSRMALSPILSNICNTKHGDVNNCQKEKEKGSDIEVPKGNLPKRVMRSSKVDNENLDPVIRIGTRRKSVGVRRIAQPSENARTLFNKETMESRSSRVRVRLQKLNSSVELTGSGSMSPKRAKKNTLQRHSNNCENKPGRSYVFSDSSVSPESRSLHQQPADKLLPNCGKKSDCSSKILGKEIPKQSVDIRPCETSNSDEMADASQQYRQNKCSKLRIRLRRNTLYFDSSSVDVNSKRRKSCHDSSLVSRLKSDWTSTSFENTPSQNRTPKDNHIPRNQVNKRRLTPLIELSVEDMTNSTDALIATPKVAPRTKSNTNEEEYSSSAEFQSDDEGIHCSRSKRAPTWKNLLNKTNDPPVLSKSLLPVVKLKKSRRLSSKIAVDRALSQEEEIKQSQLKEKAYGNSCQMEESVIEVKKAPSVDMRSKGSTEKKQKDDFTVGVSNDMTLNEKHDAERQNQESALVVSISEETISPPSTQHSNSQKPDPGQNTISNPRRDEAAKNETIDLRCPVKFFHSRLENTVSDAKTTDNPKRRRSSRRKKQESIYEFLSQSSSESNNPVDDVIQKMIKTGKVVVAKHKKGTGKNTLPRRKPERTRKKKNSKTEEIILKPTKPLAAKPIQKKIQEDFNDSLHFDDGYHFDDGENEIPEEEQVRDQRGFSNLARSAMIKQAGRIQKPLQRKPITDKKKLLAMAMKFVNQSTPVRMTPKPNVGPQLSPMQGNKSPWRVDDDKLPNLFYLGRNSDNLPSFSSDYIPMTPSKNKSKSISSFSSNDSNGENKAPPGVEVLTNDANMQALTNTRKALTYRSPLKAINIIEVVNLPPLALHSYGKKSNDENAPKTYLKGTNRSSTRKSSESVSNNNSNNYVNNNSNNNLNNNSNDNSNYNSNHSKSDVVSNENVQLEETQNQNLKNSISDVSNDNLTNLFGFEELIDDESNSTDITVDKTILPNKEALKERLQRLKQLRPDKPVVIPNKTNRIKPVFDNLKQKTLKQMLCSTMIDDNQYQSNVRNHNFNETEDLSNLFKDPDPETTFDDSLPRRTYNRQFKRKRKMLSNFSTILESDASEDEEERPVKKYKAKPKKRQKNDPELNKFVNDFNEMCKEVSQYELVVE